MGVPQCTLEETPAALNTVAPKQCHLEVDMQQDHQAIVARACRKMNRLMLPFALLFSIIASLDRANLSFASVSMSQDLGLTAMDYGLGSAIFFISYSIFQIPSNVCFIFLGGPTMLGAIAVSWGIIAASMAAVNSTSSFLAVRFMLGIAEAGTVPGIWAYLSSMYPADHLTLPTTFYMAGITAAQALGAPLAAGLLTLHGAANMAGWRWLFIIEGAPAVLLGIAIWLFLPHKVSTCKLLTPQEQQHLQAAIDGSIPPTTAAPVQISACTPKSTILASDVSSRGSSHGSIDGSSSDGGSNAGSAVERSLGSIGGGRAGSQYAMAAGMQQMKAEGAPNMQQLLADLRAAAGHRVVWCSSFWRFLYLLTLNGLIFWVPLIIHELLDVPTSNAAQASAQQTHTMLLAAVPYVAGVATHVVNALHSHRVHERRYHIAVPWFIGGLLMLMLPVAWMRQANHASYVLLVLASMGIMGCDGIDVSWIISLMASLTPSQTVLALAMINMFANFGGFVGNYVIGALKQATGHYYGAVWMMGSIMVFASLLVAAFPMSWAMTGPSEEAISPSEKGPRHSEKSESGGRDVASSDSEPAGKCEKGGDAAC